MNYDNSKVRRQDRLLDKPEALRLLACGEYGVLSMRDEDDGSYGIPVSYVWDGADNIYIHCAPEGRKLRCLHACERVSFCVTGRTEVAPKKFTTAYESIVVACNARTGLPPEERMRALELLLGKYAPDDRATGLKYAGKSFHRTEIIRLEICSVSGKCKRL